MWLNTKRTDAAGLGCNCGQRGSPYSENIFSSIRKRPYHRSHTRPFRTHRFQQQLIAVKTFIKATILIQSTSNSSRGWTGAGRVQPCAHESIVYESASRGKKARESSLAQLGFFSIAKEPEGTQLLSVLSFSVPCHSLGRLVDLT